MAKFKVYLTKKVRSSIQVEVEAEDVWEARSLAKARAEDLSGEHYDTEIEVDDIEEAK
jgi:hypothetical protein